MKLKQYAVYKGEDLIAMGTATESGKQLGVVAQTIYAYATRGRENKIKGNIRIAIELEEDDE
ncbi:hypothetical protein [Carnobacterium inhibens]|uniref:hypothetical protein n=1 Tax=Carnobacterium inhibens TaxID=147709 RepID=UPI0005567F2F|nr:hypothetical protein [Carnobacterium inhibens]